MLEARYARQMILKEIGQNGQGKLAQSRVLIVGVGGLGSPAALYLAAAGVGTIGLIDPDTVSISNLQRQVLFTTADEGQSKVERALEKLRAINPEVRCITHREFLHAANALSIMRDYDLVIDGSDNFAAKFLLNDAAVILEKPLIYGSILRWEGQLAVFWAPHGPCYRCLFPLPPRGHVPNCAEAGVIGALAGTVGSLQALEAVKVLVAGPPPWSGDLKPLTHALWMIRAATMDTQTLRIDKNPNCPTCSKVRSAIELQDLAPSSFCAAPRGLREFHAQDLLREGSWNAYQWVDVRELDEWNAGHIPGAWHWPLSELLSGQWPQQRVGLKPLLLYCHAGGRSRRAFSLMQEEGFVLEGHLKDGFQSWQGPVERGLAPQSPDLPSGAAAGTH